QRNPRPCARALPRARYGGAVDDAPHRGGGRRRSRDRVASRPHPRMRHAGCNLQQDKSEQRGRSIPRHDGGGLMRRIAAVLLLALLLPVRAFAFTIIVTDPDTPLVPNSVLELARSLGYFAREGVDVQFNRVNGTPMAVAALASGQGEMA